MFFVQINHTGKGFLFLIFREIKLRKYSSLHKLFYGLGNFVVHLRSFQGGFSYSNKIGIASPAYTIFEFKDNIKYDSIFWKEKFKSYNFIQLLKKVTYGVRDGRSISFSDFLSLYLTFPDIEIQKKIGKCFKALDNQISDQQCIIQQLKQLKQFLLQNMFI